MQLQTSLTLEAARQIIAVALATARAEAMLPMTVVVLDAGGRIVASQSEDGSGLLRFDVARGKAWGALGMGMSSRLIRDRLESRPSFQAALGVAADGKFIPVPGGVLVKLPDGSVIGAVGISGDTSEKDEFCAIKAIHASNLACEPDTRTQVGATQPRQGRPTDQYPSITGYRPTFLVKIWVRMMKDQNHGHKSGAGDHYKAWPLACAKPDPKWANHHFQQHQQADNRSAGIAWRQVEAGKG